MPVMVEFQTSDTAIIIVAGIIIFSAILPYAMGFAAGAMVFVIDMK